MTNRIAASPASIGALARIASYDETPTDRARLCALTMSAMPAGGQDRDATHAAIGATIDGFHAAAARGDRDGYLGYLVDDAVFLGTDEWERWPKEPEFREYVTSRFKDGRGWEYRSVERSIRLGDRGNTAWFDEVIESGANGRFRGTGVVTLVNGEWKIAHYAMSFLIFNEDWNTVIELNRNTRGRKAQDEAAK